MSVTNQSLPRKKCIGRDKTSVKRVKVEDVVVTRCASSSSRIIVILVEGTHANYKLVLLGQVALLLPGD